MIANPSALKKLYDAVAFFAVLNVAAVGGFCVYLLSSGVVNGEKLRGIVEVLRGEQQPEGAEQSAGAEKEKPAEPETVAVAPSIQETQMSMEVLRREAERVKVELDQKVALTNSILLRVSQEREAFKREQEQAAQRDEASREVRETVGFEKQVELYESMSPKAAVEYLLDDVSDPDEAARIIIEMDARNAKKIIEAARTPEQMDRMKVILKRLREVAPDRSDELEGTGT